MKILTVGDLHGKRMWEEINVGYWDLIIFIGDYMDDFEWRTKPEIVRQNFRDLVYWGNRHEEKVKFLLGNHEIHYLLFGTEYFQSMRGTGYNYAHLHFVNNLIGENSELFSVAYQYDNYLWTHAGVTQTHWDEDLKKDFDGFKNQNPDNCFEGISNYLNYLWVIKDRRLMRIGQDRGGLDKQGSIFWCGKNELENDMLLGYHQIVGHTPIKDIEYLSHENNVNTSVAFIDCLDKVEKFYELEL